MKSSCVVALALGVDAALVAQIANELAEIHPGHHGHHKHQVLMNHRHHRGAVLYGDTRCPCIGFDNIKGSTMVELAVGDDEKEKASVAYPADLGARCEAWDHDRHPVCKGDDKDKPGWCEQQWCIVDSCNCKIEIPPKLSVYMPMATYIGKPLFFSYATCGGKDTWTDEKLVPEIGKPKCRCIGFAGIPGSTEVAFKDGKVGTYPGEIGGRCESWDESHHPECKKLGAEAPSWCRANWCYVDPCECELPGGAVPKISAYLPEATFTGKNLYYSYETCHGVDTWTEKHHKTACVNQETEDKCAENSRCAWANKRCLGAELVNHPLCQDSPLLKVKSGTSQLASWGTALVAVLFAAMQ